jgi:hypothetical protein
MSVVALQSTPELGDAIACQLVKHDWAPDGRQGERFARTRRSPSARPGSVGSAGRRVGGSAGRRVGGSAGRRVGGSSIGAVCR